MIMRRPVERLKLDNVCDFVRRAFEPLHCIVDTHPYKDQISFRVYDEYGHLLVKSGKLSAQSICNRGYLHRTLTEARRSVRMLGFILEPLTFARKTQRGRTDGAPVLRADDVHESAGR